MESIVRRLHLLGPADRQSQAPPAGTCRSSISLTTSMFATWRSMRCEGLSFPASPRLSTCSVRSGAASNTVPSTVRSRPSESVRISLDGPGSGSISAHHTPSRHQRAAKESHLIGCAQNAARMHSKATGASATRTMLGRNHVVCDRAMPSAKSHAAWNKGITVGERLSPSEADLERRGPEVDC